MKNLGKIDWRAMQRYTNSQSVKDFDKFLDALPLNVGYNALIAAGIAWALAGASVLFTSMEIEKVSKLRAEILKVETLQPPIPVLKYTPVPKASLDKLVKKIEETYKGVSLIVGGDGIVTLSATDTDFWPQYLAAISTLKNGGKNWKVTMNTMCVGQECTGSKLATSLKIEAVRVDIPPPEVEAEE